MLVLLVQRPAIWPVLVVLAAAWCIGMGLFRYRLRSQLARWVCGGDFTKSKTKFSLEPLSQPVVLLSGETVLWYNDQFRQRMLGGQDLLVSRVQKVIPGLDLQQARTQEGQQLTLADGVWSAHSSTVPGDAETMTLVVFNEETALRRVEAEYKASRPGYLVFLVDGYDDVFSDMLDSERARLLEGINRVLEDLIGRGTGFLRRVASGRYIAVVEERHLEQYAKRGYDVLDKIRALDPSVNLSISIGIGRGAKTLREAQDMAVQALDMAQGRGGDQAAEIGGVFALGVHQVVLQSCVYFIYARFDRLDQTAATDHGREGLHVEVVLCECFEYHLLAPVELVDDARETCDLLGRMAQGERQRRLLVVIQGDLRRSRARVDC